MVKVKIGLVGCGHIATSTYLPGIGKIDRAGLVAVCDLIPERAQAASERFSAPLWYTDLEDMLQHSGIDLLVNTTLMPDHFEVNLAGLKAGKHVYSEKPMTATIAQATALLDEARTQGVKLGAAAGTMLDPVLQKVKALIADQAIGKVAYARIISAHGGPAVWAQLHPPDRYYQPGSGPVMDMGVYGLHSITGILGPAKRVSCFSGVSDPVRIERAGPRKGREIRVGMDDNTLITLDFGSATYAVVDAGYCTLASRSPRLEIYGSRGTISVGAPGQSAPIEMFRDDLALDVRGWTAVDMAAPRPGLSLNVAHMVDCILDDKDPVISGEHARHVIEIMNQCYVAAREGRTVDLETTF